jgi:hypothetical protein
LPPTPRHPLQSLKSVSRTDRPNDTSTGKLMEGGRVLRGAYEKMRVLRLPSNPDQLWYEALGESALAAGANDADIDALAAVAVRVVVDTITDPETRREQFELTATHFSKTDLTVRIRQDGSFTKVEFPNRLKAH